MRLEFIRLEDDGRQNNIGSFYIEELNKDNGNELLKFWEEHFMPPLREKYVCDSFMIDLRGRIIVAKAHEMFATHFYKIKEDYPKNFKMCLEAHGIFVDIAKRGSITDDDRDLTPIRIFYSSLKTPTVKQYSVLKLLADLHQVKLYSVIPNYRGFGNAKAEFTTLRVKFEEEETTNKTNSINQDERHAIQRHIYKGGTVIEDIEAISEDYIPLTQWWHTV